MTLLAFVFILVGLTVAVLAIKYVERWNERRNDVLHGGYIRHEDE